MPHRWEMWLVRRYNTGQGLLRHAKEFVGDLNHNPPRRDPEPLKREVKRALGWTEPRVGVEADFLGCESFSA